MRFRLALQFADLILQLAARAVKRVVDGKRQIGKPLVSHRAAVGIDLTPIGQHEADAHLIVPAALVMIAGTDDADVTSGDAAEPLFKLCNMRGNRLAHPISGFHSLERNLNGGFHNVPLL